MVGSAANGQDKRGVAKTRRRAVGRRRVRALPALAAALLALAAACLAAPAPTWASGARAAAQAPAGAAAQGVIAALRVLPQEYAGADPTHDAARAAHTRALAAAVRTEIGRWRGALTAHDRSAARTAAQASARLAHTLRVTHTRLQPWPLPQRIAAQAAAIRRALRAAGITATPPAKPYTQVDSLLAAARTAPADGAPVAVAEAYALFANGPGARLRTVDAGLASATGEVFWRAARLARRDTSGASAAKLRAALGHAASNVDAAARVLGDVSIGRTTVVVNAAVIVFREGLEAVLILAAITASFAGARRRLRRPVLAGAGLGLLASAATYMLAQTIVQALGDGGLRLQAITGLLAIAVLIVVTNWFFHRIYWSEWIARFNRRRKSLERIDRLGFISGQALGFVLLGLTSVYREGFETVLFLQNLQVSAGTGATVTGVAIGLGATFAVGLFTFALERKLPYRRMLIATGVMIGLVLATMVGTTVHNLQGLGWMPSTSAGFDIPLTWSRWLGVYPTVEGLALQIGALLVVYGSYALARQLQGRRRRRAVRAGEAALAAGRES